MPWRPPEFVLPIFWLVARLLIKATNMYTQTPMFQPLRLMENLPSSRPAIWNYGMMATTSTFIETGITSQSTWCTEQTEGLPEKSNSPQDIQSRALLTSRYLYFRSLESWLINIPILTFRVRYLCGKCTLPIRRSWPPAPSCLACPSRLGGRYPRSGVIQLLPELLCWRLFLPAAKPLRSMDHAFVVGGAGEERSLLTFVKIGNKKSVGTNNIWGDE